MNTYNIIETNNNDRFSFEISISYSLDKKAIHVIAIALDKKFKQSDNCIAFLEKIGIQEAKKFNNHAHLTLRTHQTLDKWRGQFKI
jgi:hypothetical protein